jgi:nucleoside-diphosphate-sugar epimerase
MNAGSRLEAFAGKSALVTGGYGFIGSNLVHTLVALGCNVTVVDNLDPGAGGNRFNLSGVEQCIDLRSTDIRDLDAMRDAVSGRDYVFHLAGRNSHLDSLEGPFEDLDINGRGTLTVLEAVRRENPIARIVHAGSRSEYGAIQTSPVDETHPLLPTEANSAHKALSTLYQLAYHQAHGLQTIALRLTNCYGPRMYTKDHRLGVMNWFLHQTVEGAKLRLFGDGTQQRDVLYVDDAVRAFLYAATADDAVGTVLNVGSGCPTSLRDIAEALVLLGAAGVEIVPFPEEAKRIEIGDYVADTTLTRRLLNWQPEVSLTDGLQRSVAYFREHKERYW